MNAVGLERGMEEGYTCKRCEWGRRSNSTRLMDLATLENHGRTEHRLSGAALQEFCKLLTDIRDCGTNINTVKDPQLERRPSAPQTPSTEFPGYPDPTQINDSAVLMAFQQWNQNPSGPNPQQHVAPLPQTGQVPAHMSPSLPQQGVYHRPSIMGSPQMPPHPAQVVFHGQPNQMSLPLLGFQNHNPYWVPGHVPVNHDVQMTNHYPGPPPQPPPGFMTVTHPMSEQGPGNHHFQLGHQYQMPPPAPPGYMTVAHYPMNAEAPGAINQPLNHTQEESDQIMLQRFGKRVREGYDQMMNLHKICEKDNQDPVNAAQNPVIENNITQVEVYCFQRLWGEVGVEEKKWLYRRFNFVIGAWQRMAREQGLPPHMVVTSPFGQTQPALNSMVNTSQMNNETATSHHSSASSSQPSANTSPIQPSTTPATVNNTGIPNNPFKQANTNRSTQVSVSGPIDQNMLFQHSTQATGIQSQPSFGQAPLQVSHQSPGVNPSSSAFTPTPRSISPTQITMDKQDVPNQTKDQDSSIVAQPNSTTKILPIHSNNSAIMTNPSTGGVSVTPSASDLTSISQSDVVPADNISQKNLGSEAPKSAEGSNGVASIAKALPQVAGSRFMATSSQLEKTNSTLERKRQLEDDGDSTIMGVMAAKRLRVPNLKIPGSMSQPVNGSQTIAEASMPNSLGNTPQSTLLSSSNRDPPPARTISQQHINGPVAVHKLSDDNYRLFLARYHPIADVSKLWTYDKLQRDFDNHVKEHPGYLWGMYMARRKKDHVDRLKAFGLFPMVRATIDIKNMDKNQMTIYTQTWRLELMGLMLGRLQKEKGVFTQQLNEAQAVARANELRRMVEEERRKIEEKVEAARNKVEEERKKAEEERKKEEEEEKRAEEERKKNHLDQIKELVEDKKLLYEILFQHRVGCAPIFELGDKRTWVNRELEEEECFKDLIDFKGLTAEDWEYINPSNPDPIRQRSIPPEDDVMEWF